MMCELLDTIHQVIIEKFKNNLFKLNTCYVYRIGYIKHGNIYLSQNNIGFSISNQSEVLVHLRKSDIHASNTYFRYSLCDPKLIDNMLERVNDFIDQSINNIGFQ